MKFNAIQNSFSSGEISRKLKGRTNIEEYFQASALMKNFIPRRTGGASFRPGSCFSSSNHIVNVPGALVEFTPRDGETYTLILQPGFGNAIVPAGPNYASVTITQPSYVWNARPDFTTNTAAYSPANNEAVIKKCQNIQYAQSGDVLIIVDGEGDLAPIVVFRTALNTLIVDSLLFPQQLNAATAQAWLLPPVTTARFPYKDVNVNTNVRLKNSVVGTVGASITITAENASAASIPFFVGDVVGMHVKITHASTTGVARITAKGSTSSVTATVITIFGAATASSNFETSAWNPNDGYPRSVAFFEQRLTFGGSKTYPDTIWTSMLGNIYFFMQRRLAQDASSDVSLLGFSGAVKATDPFNFVPASVGANSIQWLYPADALICGTTKNEYAISGGADSIFSSTSIFIKTLSSHGSAKVMPAKAGSSIIFVSLDGKRLLEIPRRLTEYTAATDLSAMVEGMLDDAIEATITDPLSAVKLKNKIIRIVWNEYDGVLWVLARNATVGAYGQSSCTLLSMTMDKTSKVLGWARHKLAENPSITSLCISPDTSNQGAARLFMFVQRIVTTAISGSALQVFGTEYLSYQNLYDKYYTGDPADTDDSGRNSIYLDGACLAKAVPGSSAIIGTVTTGFIEIAAVQLESFNQGTSFSVIEINNDIGTYLGDFIPANSTGVMTVPTAVTTKEYIVGVAYEGEIKTLPIEAGAQFGVAQGSDRRSNQIVICLDRSLGGTYKSLNGNNTYDILKTTDGTTSALYSGERELQLNSSYNDPQTIIKQSKPYPMNILWLLHKGYTYDT